MQWHPAAVPLGVSVLIAAIVATVAWRRRHTSPAAPALALLMSGLVLWASADALERTSVSLGAHLFWEHALYLGVVMAPAGFMALALEMTGRGHRLTPRITLLLAVHPVLVVLIVATDPLHHLFISNPVLIGVDPVLLGWERGPLFWAHTAYSYALLATGMGMLIGAWMRSARAYRRQLRSIVLAGAVPWLANVATQFRLIDVGTLDLTPIAFTFTGVVFAWALFRQRLLDLVPIAREQVVDTMGDGVVIVDPHERIADLNPAAIVLLERAGNRRGSVSVGRRAAEVFAGWDDLVPLTDEVAREITVGAGTGVVDVRGTVLRDRTGRSAGHLLVLRDVTRSRQAERVIATANRALRDQVSTIEAQLATIEQLRAELQEQAIRDSLTGLYNRRYLDEMLARELARAHREGYPVSVALLDADHFKHLNDTYGHATGDRMLAAIGRLLGLGVRGGDVACRYGGEEFLVILPNAGQPDAMSRAEQWRTGCAALRVAATDDHTGDDDGTDADHADDGEATVGVTVSIGVSTAPQDGADPASVLAAADRALYAAKRGGRDRVVAARPRSGADL
ncbi:MAG: diguanylate cyclase [Cryptosporangiaceae bacterium]|nr:diguanylate cyclase [Cryptosporangiaceae bacterium]